MKICRFCKNYANHRIQVGRMVDGEFKDMVFSCTTHFDWLMQLVNGYEGQMITLNNLGFDANGAANRHEPEDIDGWEII